MSFISKTAIIHPNVTIGRNCDIGDYVTIGELPKGRNRADRITVIGDNAIIRSHTVIYTSNVIGDNFQTGHLVMIRENNDIGNNVSIGTGSVIEHHVIVANGVRIHSQVFVPEYSILEEDCWLGPNVTLTNAKYPKSPTVKKTISGGVVKRGAKIGANSTILPGITIGEHAIVGAGSVVLKNVPSNKVVVGNPARIINDVSNLPY